MKYTTVLGDTWDIIAKKVYGDEYKADKLMDANRELLNCFIFSAGIVVNCPEIGSERASYPEGYPEWRK